MEALLRDTLEVAMVVALGGTLGAALARLRRGELRVRRCPACDRPVSRAYPRCPRCGAGRPDAA